MEKIKITQGSERSPNYTTHIEQKKNKTENKLRQKRNDSRLQH